MERFSGQTVIVTGAGQGIGYGICKAFAQEGAIVVLNDSDSDLAKTAADSINQTIWEQRVFPFVGDVSQPDTMAQMVDECSEKHGTAGIVIANAGITKYVEFLECTPETFDRVTGVNLRGSYFLAQAAAKKMIAENIPGRIVLMSSVVGLRAFLNFSVYSMTKAALQMLAKSMALELGQYGITVNSISPGAILTERTALEDPNYAENWAEVSLDKRVGQVEDIANAALFLASQEASHITGHNLVVDGGWISRSPVPEEHPDKPVNQ